MFLSDILYSWKFIVIFLVLVISDAACDLTRAELTVGCNDL